MTWHLKILLLSYYSQFLIRKNLQKYFYFPDILIYLKERIIARQCITISNQIKPLKCHHLKLVRQQEGDLLKVYQKQVAMSNELFLETRDHVNSMQ